MKTFILVTLALSLTPCAFAAKQTTVDLKEDGHTYHGTLFSPDKAKGPLPLVVVTHEWWGKTEYPEMRGKRIADELGYAALVVDLYGDGKIGNTPQEATALATPFYKDPTAGVKLLREFVAAAPEAATKDGVTLDLAKTTAIGYCFGGTQVLNLASEGGLNASGEKLLGVVSFHGGLSGVAKPEAPIQTKLLVLHGAADKMVTEKDVAAFKEEMKKAQADLDFHAYPGALHAFTNPKATELGKKFNIPIAYNEKADKDSWKRMKAFLSKLYR